MVATARRAGCLAPLDEPERLEPADRALRILVQQVWRHGLIALGRRAMRSRSGHPSYGPRIGCGSVLAPGAGSRPVAGVPAVVPVFPETVEMPGSGGGVMPCSAARIRSGDAGRSWIQTPVASWIAATMAAAGTS